MGNSIKNEKRKMNCSKLSDEMQYIERNGVCLNIDEKMRLNLAINELKCDLNLTDCALIAKVTGIVKDYFVIAANGMRYYWCSSSSWVFSELPQLSLSSEDLEKLKSINNMFTGEFDSVLFPGSGTP